MTAFARRWLLPLLIILILNLILSIRLMPTVVSQGRDNGIYSYTAKVMLDGGTLYKDAWDNKLPAIYFIDMLAFVLFGTNRWALWIMELMLITGAALALYSLFRRLTKRRVVIWSTVLIFLIFARHPDLIWDVDFPEPVALLPQALFFMLSYSLFTQPSGRTAFVMGLISSLMFLIKQTTTGMVFMFIPAILITNHPILHHPRRWRYLGLIILGGLTGLGAMLAYLVVNGIVEDAWRAGFMHARVFHQWVSLGYPNQSTFVDSVRETLTKSAFKGVMGPILPFAGIGAILAIIRQIQVRTSDEPTLRARATIGIWALLAFPADVLLTNLTVRSYEHYYVAAIMGMTLLIGLGLDALWNGYDYFKTSPKPAYHRFRGVMALVIVASLGYIFIGYGTRTAEKARLRLEAADWDITGPLREAEQPIIDFVKANTEPDDMVWVWGATTSINFQSKRDSPTQYHYAYPLIVPDYTTDDMLEEVVRDLDTHQTRLIIDRAWKDGRRIPPLDPARRDPWYRVGGRRDAVMPDLIWEWIQANCDPAISFDRGRQYIYFCH